MPKEAQGTKIKFVKSRDQKFIRKKYIDEEEEGN